MHALDACAIHSASRRWARATASLTTATLFLISVRSGCHAAIWARATLPEYLLSRLCAAQLACIMLKQYDRWRFPDGHFIFGTMFCLYSCLLTVVSYVQEMERGGPASPPPPVTRADASDKLAAAALSAALVGYTAYHFSASSSATRLVMVRLCLPKQFTGNVQRDGCWTLLCLSHPSPRC